MPPHCGPLLLVHPTQPLLVALCVCPLSCVYVYLHPRQPFMTPAVSNFVCRPLADCVFPAAGCPTLHTLPLSVIRQKVRACAGVAAQVSLLFRLFFASTGCSRQARFFIPHSLLCTHVVASSKASCVSGFVCLAGGFLVRRLESPCLGKAPARRRV